MLLCSYPKVAFQTGHQAGPLTYVKDETDAAQMADTSAVWRKYMAATIKVLKIFLVIFLMETMKMLLFVVCWQLAATPAQARKICTLLPAAQIVQIENTYF